MTVNLILITLLVKLGVVASVASVLARVTTFRRLFFAEHRTPRQTLGLLAFIVIPLTLGVWIRTAVPNFLAADISFETVILLGLLLGPSWAMLGGAALSLPALHHHEYLALPFDVALGLVAGMLGRFVGKEEIWSFTPFIDLSLYRWVRRILRRPRDARIASIAKLDFVAFAAPGAWNSEHRRGGQCAYGKGPTPRSSTVRPAAKRSRFRWAARGCAVSRAIKCAVVMPPAGMALKPP